MGKDKVNFYRFGPFQIDLRNGQLLRNGAHVPLTPKAFKLLLVFVENAGQVVGKDLLLKLVWNDTSVAGNIISVNVAALRKALEDGMEGNVYITTVPKRGYQFVAKVETVLGDAVAPLNEGLAQNQEASTQRINPVDNLAKSPYASLLDRMRFTLGGHFWHAVASCGIYASYYSVALLLEVAYKFNIYGTKAILTAPLLFCWIFITSLLALAIAVEVALSGKSYGLALGLAVFVAAAAIAFGCAALVLPNVPVTEAKFQTYAAPAAYLKDIAYILPVALLFLLVPFHFVTVLEQEIRQGKGQEVFELLTKSRFSTRPAGTAYIKFWVFGALLAGLLAYYLPARAHLFDNLTPTAFLGLFEVLHQTLTFLQFTLGLYCLGWYYWALNRLRSECLQLSRGA